MRKNCPPDSVRKQQLGCLMAVCDGPNLDDERESDVGDHHLVFSEAVRRASHQHIELCAHVAMSQHSAQKANGRKYEGEHASGAGWPRRRSTALSHSDLG